MKRGIQTSLIGFALIVALPLSAFLSLGIHEASAAGHHGGDCPFMPGEQAICSMSVFEHLTAWQEAFGAVPSAPVAFVTLLVVFANMVGLILLVDIARASVHKRLDRQRLPTLYQLLFADGLLNPKTH